mmetsp:Transcript_48286/g.113483  ORF Transcript_48286/g.113483 Transcript_48286/m.113483 type:complete len:239 (+) Transcript_48286:236-952(+)
MSFARASRMASFVSSARTVLGWRGWPGSCTKVASRCLATPGGCCAGSPSYPRGSLLCERPVEAAPMVRCPAQSARPLQTPSSQPHLAPADLPSGRVPGHRSMWVSVHPSGHCEMSCRDNKGVRAAVAAAAGVPLSHCPPQDEGGFKALCTGSCNKVTGNLRRSSPNSLVLSRREVMGPGRKNDYVEFFGWLCPVDLDRHLVLGTSTHRFHRGVRIEDETNKGRTSTHRHHCSVSLAEV